MTRLLDKAVPAAQELPAETQDRIARLMLSIVEEQRPYRFSPDEAAELNESLAAERRGDFATEAEVRAIWAKHRV